MTRAKRPNKRRGTITIVILVIALSAAAMIASTLTMTTGAATIQRNAKTIEQAVFLADAGMEHAMIMLKNNPAWRTGFTNVALGAGTYSVTLVDDNADVIVTSTGTIGTLTKQLSIRVGWN